MTKVIDAPIERVIPNPQQPRIEFDPVALDELAYSIRVNGLLQLPTAEEAADGYYIIHDGERRLRAVKSLGWTTIKLVVEPPLNGDGPRERLVRAVAANAHRADLNPIEKAKAYQQMGGMGMTHKQIARVVNTSVATVSSYLKLLELDEALQNLVGLGLLPHDIRVIRAFLSIPNRDARIRLGQRLGRPGITIKGIESACRRLVERMTLENPVTRAEPPILALSKPQPKTTHETWKRVRVAAKAMCDTCDVNPGVPNAPEPAWTLILESAHQTCDACNLRPLAKNDLNVCAQCPGVELLKRLARSS